MNSTELDVKRLIAECTPKQRAELWVELAWHWLRAHPKDYDPCALIDEEGRKLGMFYPLEPCPKPPQTEEEMWQTCLERLQHETGPLIPLDDVLHEMRVKKIEAADRAVQPGRAISPREEFSQKKI